MTLFWRTCRHFTFGMQKMHTQLEFKRGCGASIHFVIAKEIWLWRAFSCLSNGWSFLFLNSLLCCFNFCRRGSEMLHRLKVLWLKIVQVHNWRWYRNACTQENWIHVVQAAIWSFLRSLFHSSSMQTDFGKNSVKRVLKCHVEPYFT